MKRTIYLLLALSLAAAACQSGPKKEKTEEKTTTAPSFNKDSSDIREAVLSFYAWYSTNFERLMKYDLYSGTKKPDAPPYKINWDEAKKYQQFIRDSIPQLGEAFQGNLELLLKKADSAFKVDVADDVPYYFDYDWYLNTQEDAGYIYNEMKNSKQWIINISGDDAGVEVKGFDENGTKAPATVISLKMKREQGVWKIAKIGEM